VSEPLLVVDDVNASYSTYRALFGVSLSVPEGGAVALLGSNGAGKSTVARVVSGLVPVTSGSVRFGGEEITGMPAHRIARLGMSHVPEGRGIFSSLSVQENLELSFLRRSAKGAVGGALTKAFDAFPVLAQRRRQAAGTLSGGEQRMLCLAKVLAVPPRLLIADELSLGLAPLVVDAVYDGLAAIRANGSAVLIVEQQVGRALALADHAVVLAKGSVAWTGSPDDAPAAVERLLTGEATTDAEPSPADVDPASNAAAPHPETALR
jgi:branched-chain amino acid transport system ATP-binding protein